uniref:Uncharacterized protein n=1 Tax=Steinernema glaseri TaxID=37863 RepID=A0A1I7YKY6_9BILA
MRRRDSGFTDSTEMERSRARPDNGVAAHGLRLAAGRSPNRSPAPSIHLPAGVRATGPNRLRRSKIELDGPADGSHQNNYHYTRRAQRHPLLTQGYFMASGPTTDSELCLTETVRKRSDL